MKRKQSNPKPGRIHGDSYSDVPVRDADLDGSTSTHGELIDRRAEEPSDEPVDDAVRLEGDL